MRKVDGGTAFIPGVLGVFAPSSPAQMFAPYATRVVTFMHCHLSGGARELHQHGTGNSKIQARNTELSIAIPIFRKGPQQASRFVLMTVDFQFLHQGFPCPIQRHEDIWISVPLPALIVLAAPLTPVSPIAAFFYCASSQGQSPLALPSTMGSNLKHTSLSEPMVMRVGVPDSMCPTLYPARLNVITGVVEGTAAATSR